MHITPHPAFATPLPSGRGAGEWGASLYFAMLNNKPLRLARRRPAMPRHRIKEKLHIGPDSRKTQVSITSNAANLSGFFPADGGRHSVIPIARSLAGDRKPKTVQQFNINDDEGENSAPQMFLFSIYPSVPSRVDVHGDGLCRVPAAGRVG